MAENRPANPLEQVAYTLSREINNGETIFVGTGLPMVAAILAQKTHAPDITLVYESGGQDPMEGDMPWSVGGPFTWRKSPMIVEMALSFAQAANGYVDRAFLGFAQIDMYGNVNTHIIGGDFLNPDTRLTGSGGNNDLSSLCEEMVLVGLQTPDKFVERVDFITSPGHLEGGNSRQKAGLFGKGPVAVVSPAATFDFHEKSKRMRMRTLNEGVTAEFCQLATGFELVKPDGDIPRTPKIPDDTLAILREEVDPRGVFTSM